MSFATPPDAAERAKALDTTRSFLIQAPAGAGKTELLVRRYLALLAQATEPEEVLAVTFTRKAAAEMQERVIRALSTSERDLVNADTELQSLVAGVRQRDAERGWRLTACPARLRISTIDALNAALARSTPVAAGGNVMRPIAADSERLYRLAAQASIQHLAETSGTGAAVASLLRHLDNNPGVAENLLATLLARRDQWLPLVGAAGDRHAMRRILERTLATIVEAGLARVEAAIPPPQFEALNEIAHAAALNLKAPLKSPAGSQPTLTERHAWWQFMARLLLTQNCQWRKTLNKTNGFPPDQKDLKAHAMALLNELQNCPDLLEALSSVCRLPAPEYPPAQWRALEALLMLLPIAVAELKLIFAAENATDYTEVAMEGRAALGSAPLGDTGPGDTGPGDDAPPSDLALRLDWRLQHILLDEFQDTSRAQYELLQALTRGWSPGDGRTLFLVGDPMQSIYRFRQAEVGLFIDVRDSGLPDVQLEFLRLRANFRSVPALIDWVNDSFEKIFPARDEVMSGAISFASSASTRDATAQDAPAVTLHDCNWQEPEAEAAAVLEVVRHSLKEWPGRSIGILVRGRAHARHIVPALRAAGIPLSANELVSLGQSVLTNDLLSIVRALVHAGDRLAWMSVLRAPWCGLTLADLTILCTPAQPGANRADSLWDRIQTAGVTVRLSADGQQRLSRVVTAFSAGFVRLGQIPLRDVVEGIWLELGGPAVAGLELPLAELILAEIDRHDVAGDCPTRCDSHAP
ncbi:MAG: UvrD-helicase domain-containing protein [Gammaproteobacteria bacterium]